MSEGAKIVLDLIRHANRCNISFRPGVIRGVIDDLGLSEIEVAEIGEIVAADIRELNASYPGFANVVKAIDAIIPDKYKKQCKE